MRAVVAVLLYPGCIFFEIALAAEVLARRMRVQYYTPNGEVHSASNGAHIDAEGNYSALSMAEPAAVLVPGGDPRVIVHPDELASQALRESHQRGAVIAGICAGNLVIAAAGLLRRRRGTHNYTAEYAPSERVEATARYWVGMNYERADVVCDQRVITAQPWAYRKYAAAVAGALGVLSESEASELEGYVRLRTVSDA